ncbi:cyclin-T1 isoform X2 [Pseudophryne corroboree]|uniref:cyclin-T1 isoform X2 n=1 Tax=Pseudophryne corroboree TaxID=495146 RepID=UPI0030815EBA
MTSGVRALQRTTAPPPFRLPYVRVPTCTVMAPPSRWYFTREQLERSPSRRAGLDPDKELSYRQQAANLLQDMGQRLNVSQLTINTAIVYMHRFYMVQSFTRFHRNTVAPAALFLAAKVEEQPRKLEYVIKVAHACLNPQEPAPDTRSEAYLQQAQDLVILESIILQTLGFEITIDHPHTHVVKCTQLVRASKDLAQTSYFMATNSLHLTTFSLQYTPPVVACVCIHLACKWSNWEIPVSTDGKPWWEYVDVTVTLKLLDELTHEFLQILEKTPNRLKGIRNWRINQANQKPKEDGCEDEDGNDSLSEQTILRMLSRSGVMSNSPFSDSSSQSFSVSNLDSGIYGGSWGAPLNNQLEQNRTSEHNACIDQSQLPVNKPAPIAKVSLKEYRAKHAEELAAQKRQLEHMGASLKEQYACAAQNLLIQQQRDRDRESHTSPIILKIPLHEVSHERTEKSTSLKLRLPVSNREKPEEGKIRIKVPNEESSGSSSSKSRDKHRSGSSSSHHHHHHNSQSHRQHNQDTSSSSTSKRSSISLAAASHKSSAPSRKRPPSEDISSHELPPHKVSRTSKLPSANFPVAQAPHRARSSHDKTDREPSGANGHGASKVIDYQDTVNMLHSLLSAQGMQPMQPPQYLHQYGEYRRPRPSSTDKPRPPPLPAEPPPPLPPLPK